MTTHMDAPPSFSRQSPSPDPSGLAAKKDEDALAFQLLQAKEEIQRLKLQLAGQNAGPDSASLLDPSSPSKGRSLSFSSVSSAPASPTANGVRTSSPSPANASRIPVRSSSPSGGRIPMARAFLSDESDAQPPIIRHGSRSPEPDARSELTADGLPAANAHAGSNPFFGGGSGRNRVLQGQISAASGTGRVITGLQQDLATARSALESTRGQLRLSQRAVEFLTRQTEDLKDGRERLRLENENLNKMVSRKERLLAETLERARAAESEVKGAKAEVIQSADKRKQAEAKAADAEGRKKKYDSEYEAMKSSVKGLKSEWQKDVTDLRSQMSKLEEQGRKDLDDAKSQHKLLAKLYKARDTELQNARADVQSLRDTREEFGKRLTAKLEEVSKEMSNKLAPDETLQESVTATAAELDRILKLIRKVDRSLPPQAPTG